MKKRMRHHARDMNELVWAVSLLDWVAAQKKAEDIAREVEAGPMQGPAPAGTQPGGLAYLYAQLGQKATAVASAARVRDSRQMGMAYAGLSQVCVDCHAVYRGDPGAGAPPAAQ